LDLHNPELTAIFRQELEERSRRLVEAARALSEGSVDASSIADLVRDAHTIKGSAGMLEYPAIAGAAARLEKLWRRVSEGNFPEPEVIVAMEATAGRLLSSMEKEDPELGALVERLDSGLAAEGRPEVVPLREPETGSLGGLLTSVSDTLLGGATRVDTGDLYRLINRIVEVALDAEALADLSVVSVEGLDPEVFRRSWRAQLERLSGSINDIQDQAVALANVSFFDAVATLPQFVRYLGRRLDKDVRLELIGDDVQLDRQIIDLVRDPLRHLLVNAVDHGIEPPDKRLGAGKAGTGRLTVGANVIADRVEISVVDDGRGIDWDRVAQAAREHGLDPVPRDLVPVLLHPGFSTIDAANDFSGTGEGLAMAAEAVNRVNGTVRIESEPGAGTTVTLTLPLSMVLQNVVVVAVGDRFFGLPEAAVEAAMPLSKAELTSTEQGRELSFRSNAMPCVSLSLALGVTLPPDESELLVVSTRSGMVAVTVSELIDRRRVAVKNLGPILEGAGHITGAALLGGSQVLVVLDPDFLGMVAHQRPRLVEDRPRVLVVDDSAGVRQLLSATLNGAGFDVEVASGAREAILAMAADDFDALVVDYSMPRSNGVELVRAMRAADVTVPIIMVSGVATPEEKEAAWEAGVDAYLDKYDLRHGVLTKTLRQLMGMENADSA